MLPRNLVSLTRTPPSGYLPSWSCVSDSLLSESSSLLNVRQRYPFFFRIWQMRKPARPMTKKTKTSRTSIYKPCWGSTSPSVALLCSDIRSYKTDGKTQSSLKSTFVVPTAAITMVGDCCYYYYYPSLHKRILKATFWSLSDYPSKK